MSPRWDDDKRNTTFSAPWSFGLLEDNGTFIQRVIKSWHMPDTCALIQRFQ